MDYGLTRLALFRVGTSMAELLLRKVAPRAGADGIEDYDVMTAHDGLVVGRNRPRHHPARQRAALAMDDLDRRAPRLRPRRYPRNRHAGIGQKLGPGDLRLSSTSPGLAMMTVTRPVAGSISTRSASAKAAAAVQFDLDEVQRNRIMVQELG